MPKNRPFTPSYTVAPRFPASAEVRRLRGRLMLKIYNCIAYAHDLKLVGLAALVCVLASFAAINLLRHARKSSGQMRNVWLAVSAISTGFGIWATHFVAMLAFTPGIPSGYNISLTILSLVAAISLTAVGLAVSLTPNWRHGPWIGGAIVAGGIAAMHYTGMAAFEIAGIILWDPVLVVASIVLGAAIGAVALPVGLHGQRREMEDRRRAAADAGDLQPSLHGDGCGVDHSRSHHRGFAIGAARRMAGGGRGDRELRHHRAGAGRRRARYPRPPTFRTRSRPDARSRRCVRRGASGLRRRDDRLPSTPVLPS